MTRTTNILLVVQVILQSSSPEPQDSRLKAQGSRLKAWLITQMSELMITNVDQLLICYKSSHGSFSHNITSYSPQSRNIQITFLTVDWHSAAHNLLLKRYVSSGVFHNISVSLFCSLLMIDFQFTVSENSSMTGDKIIINSMKYEIDK